MEQNRKHYMATIMDFGSERDMARERAEKMLAFPKLRGALEIYRYEGGPPGMDAVLLALWVITESEAVAAAVKETLADEMERISGDRTRAIRLDRWPTDVSGWPVVQWQEGGTELVAVRPDYLEANRLPWRRTEDRP